MTMQTSGAISLGQALAECRIAQNTNPTPPNGNDAATGALSQLAGVGSGQRYAWSYWYGKSNLPVIQNVLFASYHVYVDRDAFENIDFRTGANTAYGFNGNGGPGLRSYTPTAQYAGGLPRITEYGSWSCSVAKVSGRSNVTIQQQPNPGNDWQTIIYVDDNPWSGQTDVTVNVYITANP